MHLSQNWIDYKFVVRQPSVQPLQDSNTEARSWLFRGSWNTSTGGEGERGNMLRTVANFIADMYHCTLACYIAARKRLITEPSMFLWTSAFSTSSLRPLHIFILFPFTLLLSFFLSPSPPAFSPPQRSCTVTTQIGRQLRHKNEYLRVEIISVANKYSFGGLAIITGDENDF